MTRLFRAVYCSGCGLGTLSADPPTAVFDFAPELTHYLASVSSSRRLAINVSHGAHWRVFRTVGGMIGMVTAVLTELRRGHDRRNRIRSLEGHRAGHEQVVAVAFAEAPARWRSGTPRPGVILVT